MDVLIINALLNSLMNVLSTMANLVPKPGDPIAKKDNLARGEVTGLLDMESDIAKGSMAISFTTGFIKSLVKRMVGDEIKQVDDTAKDLTGEMANMIVGGAKAILSEKGIDISMSTPQVLSGNKHEINHKYPGQTVILPFKSEEGEFFLEINFV
ncbi:MAG: chemotaxis protein CheX [Gammaproteobacteria bacterium]|nr:chemotaxis protein CheX [Gammaproteobacteria bacterium]MDH5651053.1 chemotaxis protein CheX [Gammaproteobacteria bacterium]